MNAYLPIKSKFYNQMYNKVCQQQTTQIRKTYYPCSHIYSHISFTQITSMNLKHIFLCNHLGGYIYMHAPFSTSLDTLLRSSKAEKLLNLICPIVLLFTSFALPSTDKFAEKMSNSPDTCLSFFYIFLLRILVKKFLGKGNSQVSSI
jgi:hypothetical protein